MDTTTLNPRKHDELLAIAEDYFATVVDLAQTDRGDLRRFAERARLLVAGAAAEGDVEFLQDAPLLLERVARSYGVAIQREAQEAWRERVLLFTRIGLYFIGAVA